MDCDAAIFCRGKASFPTRALAMRAVERMRRRRAKIDNLGTYRCRKCGDWHVGNYGPTVKRRAVKELCDG